MVLFFYPAAMTSGCTAEACNFRDLAAEFAAAGAQRVGISRDKVDKQRQFAELHGFDYPLLSDPDSAVAAALGRQAQAAAGPAEHQADDLRDRHRPTVLEVIHSERNMNEHADRALGEARSALVSASMM